MSRKNIPDFEAAPLDDRAKMAVAWREYFRDVDRRTPPVPFSTTTPTNGQFYTYNSTTGLLEPVSQSPAVLNATPSNPTATSSGTPLMMGLGGTCALTTTYKTRIKFSWSGLYSNTSTGATGLRFYYGTGTAPANAAATTGTQVGPTWAVTCPSAAATIPFSVTIIVTGLTVSTAYWFDVAVNAGSNTSSISAIDFAAMEI